MSRTAEPVGVLFLGEERRMVGVFLHVSTILPAKTTPGSRIQAIGLIPPGQDICCWSRRHAQLRFPAPACTHWGHKRQRRWYPRTVKATRHRPDQETSRGPAGDRWDGGIKT